MATEWTDFEKLQHADEMLAITMPAYAWTYVQTFIIGASDMGVPLANVKMAECLEMMCQMIADAAADRLFEKKGDAS